jgi:hypothetical protein
MATTTPNYGWPVPTSSDLVKNGATAIEALGDAADATMATMVAKTIIDAKGDLIAGTAADTAQRLAVGTNGQTLVADSTASTGLKWATLATGKVLQVVQGSTATQVGNSTSTHADTGLTATITPSSASSRILVLVSQAGTGKINNTRVEMYINRGATQIIRFANYLAYTNSGLQNIETVSTAYLDSPATTSATTYKTTFASADNIAEVWVQLAGAATSTIILMEIGA